MQKEDNTGIADNEIISTRVLNATPQAVFNAWENPALLKQWWGPKGFTNTFHQFNFEANGCWDFTMHAADGTDYYNEIVFEKIIKPSMIICKHLGPHHVFTVTASFEPLGDKTNFIFHMRFESAEECQKIKSFIESANEENLDRLEFVLLNNPLA